MEQLYPGGLGGRGRGNRGGRAPYMGRGRGRSDFRKEVGDPSEFENNDMSSDYQEEEDRLDKENTTRKRLNFDPSSGSKEKNLINPNMLSIQARESEVELPVTGDKVNSTPEKVQVSKRTKRNEDSKRDEISATSDVEVDRMQ